MNLSFLARRAICVPLTAWLLAGLAAGCGESKKPEEEAQAAPVKVAGIETYSYAEWTELLGTSQPLPNHSARVSAAIEGRVSWVLGDGQGTTVVEGMDVLKNQIVVKLDDRVARANRDKAAAAEEEIKEQQKQADLAVDLAMIDVNRLDKLKPMGKKDEELPLVSRIELEKARLALKDAESKKKGAIAKLESNKAEVRALDEQLALYQLRAPIAGRLGLIQVVPGQTLSVGTTVAEIVQLDEVDVLCYVSPHTASKLARGNLARVQGQPDLLGKIEYIALTAQPDTGNFAVKARFPNPELRLRANAVLRILVQTQAPDERFTIPESALMEDQEPPAVVVLADKTEKNKEGKEETIHVARKLWARVGVRDRDRKPPVVELLSLEDDQHKPVDFHKLQFIVEGGHGLADGDPVKVKEEERQDKAVSSHRTPKCANHV